MNANTLFGAPLGFTPTGLQEWVDSLTSCWRAYAGQGPQSLSGDLNILKTIYAHGASAAKLRTTFAELPDDALQMDLPSEVALSAEGRQLITPEGRILLDVLIRLRRTDDHVIGPDEQVRALALAASTRSSWYEAWAMKQVAGSLSPAPIAAAILVLINGSTTPDRGFYLPDVDAQATEYQETVLRLLGDFSDTLGGKRPTSAPLQSHWVFTQATRVLSRDLARLNDTSSGSRVYVRPEREKYLLHDLTARLDRYPASTVARGLRGLVEGYHQHRGLIAVVSGSYERAANTRMVLASLAHGGM